MINHDLLIIGGGLAGMRAALESSKEIDVAVISKVHPLRSHSGAGWERCCIGRQDIIMQRHVCAKNMKTAM